MKLTPPIPHNTAPVGLSNRIESSAWRAERTVASAVPGNFEKISIAKNPAMTTAFIEAVTSVLYFTRLFESVPQFIGEHLHAFVAGVTGDSDVFNLPR